jgi:hypothetical protein
MLSHEIKALVEQATVSLTPGRGRGSLVNGSLILTAAHCVPFECYDRETKLDELRRPIIIRNIPDGDKGILTKPFAAEPVEDVAVLGALDKQEDAEQFKAFCERTTPLKLCDAEFPLFNKFPVHVFTHEGGWVAGLAQQCQINGTALLVEFEKSIPGGTSGSPIINNDGVVVGIISWVSEPNSNGRCSGSAPRPMLTLPVWMVRYIQDNS